MLEVCDWRLNCLPTIDALGYRRTSSLPERDVGKCWSVEAEARVKDVSLKRGTDR